MSRRIPALFSVLLLGLALAAPALARTPVIAQQSIKHAGALFLRHGLAPGHSYRLVVESNGHQRFSGSAVENYVFVQNRALRTSTKPLNLKGTTPYAMTLKQPISGHVSEWILAVTVQTGSNRGVTVRLVDLGRHK